MFFFTLIFILFIKELWKGSVFNVDNKKCFLSTKQAFYNDLFNIK